MAFITNYNFKRLVGDYTYQSESVREAFEEIAFNFQPYVTPIYFFNKKELLEFYILEQLLTNANKFYSLHFKPVVRKADTFNLMYENISPSYHSHSDCPFLHSDYFNFQIPDFIREQGQEKVISFRNWFEEVRHLFENNMPAFIMRYELEYKRKPDIESININNSGSHSLDGNATLVEVEQRINDLLVDSKRYYFNSPRHTEILKRYSKIAYKYDIKYELNIETQFTDEEVREILKFYQLEIKRPIKDLLFNYLILKLNPNVEISADFLKEMGFTLCNSCALT